MKPSVDTGVPRWLAIAGVVAAIISMCIAAIALIPDFGQWLKPPATENSFTSTATATEIAATDAPTSPPTLPPPSTPVPTPFTTDTETPASTHAQPPTSTPTSSPTHWPGLLFQDDFESKLSNWLVWDDNWDVDADGARKHVLCLGAPEYYFVFAGSQQWRDYTLQFDLKIRVPRDPPGGESALVRVRVEVPEPAYEALFHHEDGIGLSKVTSGRINDVWLGDSQRELVDNQWYKVQIQVLGPNIRILVDGDLVIEARDKDNPWQAGSIGLGVAPGAEVCYDKVVVTALESNP